MIKVSVMYPSGEGTRFDMDYYLEQHFQLVRKLLGSAVKKAAVEQGISGPLPGSQPAYIAMGHMWFESVDAFQTAFAQHGQTLMNDIPNYTNAKPTIQVSEVKL